jgi:hypothetical protein
MGGVMKFLISCGDEVCSPVNFRSGAEFLGGVGCCGGEDWRGGED